MVPPQPAPPSSLRSIALAASMLLALSQACARMPDEDDLALAYGDRPEVSIATGTQLPLSRAPAVATVITAEDIAAIGATDLDEVLETVPGLHVARFNQAFSPMYVIRGIHLGYNPQVLMLVNGVPITSIFSGNRGNVWGGMPVSNIERVEVIRGPGSAVYGADALAGVINIVTRTGTGLEGTEVGASLGSFKTGDAWMLHGGQWGAVQVGAYLRRGTTDGARRTVKADAQTGWDSVLGTRASHAPGPLDLERDFVDAALDLSLGRWRWRADLAERQRVGSANGVASALDPDGRSHSRRLGTDLTFDAPDAAPGWSASAQVSLMQYKEFSNLTLFPPGASFGSGVFSEGMVGNPDKWERHARVAAWAVYSGWDGHRVRLGAGVVRDELHKVAESKNFDPYTFTPLGEVEDVTDTAPFINPHHRTTRYLVVQDEWQFARDWALTAGVRHDHHSDFGDTTNPRLALVWEAAYDLTAKLLYGTAFRAPSMSELYAINNPVAQGNPELRAERIRTVEAALSWQPSPALQVGANVFHYRMTDQIRQVASVYSNDGTQTGRGFELEATWTPRPRWRVTGNYSHQRATSEDTDSDAGNAPHHHLYLRTDWTARNGWSVHGQLNWIGERRRVAGDPRPPLRGYRMVDLTLRSPEEHRWRWSLSVRNLLDEDAREPSPDDHSAAQPFISLPDDFPLPGRAVVLQGSYRF